MFGNSNNSQQSDSQNINPDFNNTHTVNPPTEELLPATFPDDNFGNDQSDNQSLDNQVQDNTNNNSQSYQPTSPNTGNDDLLNLKQKALQELEPLVGQLEQTPEEKFKTTMMLIQASDNKSLLPKAYEAAQNISDPKAKAQALLDVVNEINYFSQH